MYSYNGLLHYDNMTLFERFTEPENHSQNKFVKSIVRDSLNKTTFGYDEVVIFLVLI